MPRPAPQFIEDEVPGNLEQPGGEFRPRLITLHILPYPDENLLGDVFRIRVRSEHAADGSDNEALMALDQRLKRRHIAGAGETHQPNVLGVFWCAAGWAGFVNGH